MPGSVLFFGPVWEEAGIQARASVLEPFPARRRSPHEGVKSPVQSRSSSGSTRRCVDRRGDPRSLVASTTGRSPRLRVARRRSNIAHLCDSQGSPLVRACAGWPHADIGRRSSSDDYPNQSTAARTAQRPARFGCIYGYASSVGMSRAVMSLPIGTLTLTQMQPATRLSDRSSRASNGAGAT
jgi:hypothetical protein